MKKHAKALHTKIRTHHAKHTTLLRKFKLPLLAGSYVIMLGLSWWLPNIALGIVVIFGFASLLLRLESSSLFQAAIAFLIAAGILTSVEQDAAGEHVAVCAFVLLVFGAMSVVMEQLLSKNTMPKRVDRPANTQ